MDDEANVSLADKLIRRQREKRLKKYLQAVNKTAAWNRGSEKHQPQYTSCRGHMMKLYLYLTFDCPFHCPYCYANGGRRKTKEMSARRFAELTAEAVRLGFEAVVLVGGEPLVYSQFAELLEAYRSLETGDTRLVLRSSFALPIPDDQLEQLCDIFDTITVSIDGDEKLHDSQRGQGTYARTLENVKRARALRTCQIGINSVMSLEEYHGQPGRHVKALCRELGIARLTIQSHIPLGRSASHVETDYIWRKDKEKDSFPLPEEPRFSCGIGHSLYVEPDGTVYPCYTWCSGTARLGNLSQASLTSLIDSGVLLPYINYGVEQNEKCRDCEVRYFCGGQCKIWSADKTNLASGDFDCSAQKEQLLEKARLMKLLP